MICVDELREIKDDITTNLKCDRKQHLMQGCLLFTDDNDIKALHEFAKEMNISRESFKDFPPLARYILNEEQRELAVKNGAKEVAFKNTVSLVRRNFTIAHKKYNLKGEKMKGENMKSKIIILVISLMIFMSLFTSFWFIFLQYYFNASDRGIVLGIIIACILSGSLLTYAMSNIHKVFSWQEFKVSKSPIELRLLACEAWAEAGMMEKEGMKQIEDRMKMIDERHDLEFIKLKAEIQK